MNDQEHQKRKYLAISMAILAALLYGFSAPFSKMLLQEVPAALMAALLYLGAGLGMMCINLIIALSHKGTLEAKLTKKETPFIIAMIFLDIAAPILLMLGLKMTTASNASLLNNFEIVATSFIALMIFKETIGKRMWLAIALISLSSFVLSLSDLSGFSFSLGSILVLLACIAWGFENNCTRMLSLKDPLQIVVIKGMGSGIGALIIAFASKSVYAPLTYVAMALLLGFLAYGLSIYLYIRAQRDLGAARTSAFYAAAPFIGVLLSWLVIKEPITAQFLVALLIMIWGTYFAVTEDHAHAHAHEAICHNHIHNHQDGHHTHTHDYEISGAHSHEHVHEPTVHVHPHLQDLHHRHTH